MWGNGQVLLSINYKQTNILIAFSYKYSTQKNTFSVIIIGNVSVSTER